MPPNGPFWRVLRTAGEMAVTPILPAAGHSWEVTNHPPREPVLGAVQENCPSPNLERHWAKHESLCENLKGIIYGSVTDPFQADIPPLCCYTMPTFLRVSSGRGAGRVHCLWSEGCLLLSSVASESFGSGGLTARPRAARVQNLEMVDDCQATACLSLGNCLLQREGGGWTWIGG